MNATIRIKVRGYHLDLYGHVNNTRYLEFLEEARWHIKEKYLDLPSLNEQNIGIVIVNTNINYRRPAKLGDKLEISSFVTRIGKKSITLRQEIFLAGTDTRIADADVTFVLVDHHTEKALAIDAKLRQPFEQLMLKEE